jgi:alginate O-acetyltransferase complex protein AlgI
MLFNSLTFAIFIFIVYALYWRLSHKNQNYMLLIASYVFYGSWDYRFLSLIILSTITDYYCGLKIHKAKSRSEKLPFLWLSLVMNLGLLGFFKYAGFFVQSFADLLARFSIDSDIGILSIVLPVGISFYTLQTLSYTIDIYRGKLKPVDNFWTFSLFVSFFPQLVAGPIERAVNLVPQLIEKRKPTVDDFLKGTWCILFGFFLKIFIADNMAHIVDHTYSKTTGVNGWEVLSSTYGFAYQIFADFAGYSSIAIGLSRLMGIKLMTNFIAPYFVTNPSDFWKNWHISLSTWIKDYLYISMGGNRGGMFKHYRNLALTMLIAGLWHGAAWNFILWGAYQGGILILHRLVEPFLNTFANVIKINQKVWFAIRMVFMFHMTCYGWLIFRAESFNQIVEFTKSLLFNLGEITQVSIYNLKFVGFYIAPLIIIQIIQVVKKDQYAIARFSLLIQSLVYTLMYLIIMLFGEFHAQEFIYFQF